MGWTWCPPHGFTVVVDHTVSPMGHTFVHPMGLSIVTFINLYVHPMGPGNGRCVNPMGPGSQRVKNRDMGTFLLARKSLHRVQVWLQSRRLPARKSDISSSTKVPVSRDL